MGVRSEDMKRQIAALTIALAFGCAAASGAASSRDGAVIRNTGSTNFLGYTVKVWSDGATWAVHANREGTPYGQPVTGHIAPSLAQTFLADARQARKNAGAPQHCMKSASFGTTTVVTYHGWTSSDLECAGGGFTVALAADAHKIAALLKLQGVQVRRIPMLRNEPRRAPSDTPAAQATPTPEPSTPAA